MGKNFSFPTSADASVGVPSGTRMVRSHFRAAPKPKYAQGGSVNTGNATVQRKDPVVESDKTAGGKGPLRTGYSKGGKTKGCK